MSWLLFFTIIGWTALLFVTYLNYQSWKMVNLMEKKLNAIDRMAREFTDHLQRDAAYRSKIFEEAFEEMTTIRSALTGKMKRKEEPKETN